MALCGPVSDYQTTENGADYEFPTVQRYMPLHTNSQIPHWSSSKKFEPLKMVKVVY